MSALDMAVKKHQKAKMSITIDRDIFEKFNEIAKANKYNKSQTISNLIKMFIESKN